MLSVMAYAAGLDPVAPETAKNNIVTLPESAVKMSAITDLATIDDDKDIEAYINEIDQSESPTETEKADEPVEPEYEEYLIQPGDSLSSIAKKFYGDETKYSYIAGCNNLDSNEYIYAGETIKLYRDTTKTVTLSYVTYSSGPSTTTTSGKSTTNSSAKSTNTNTSTPDKSGMTFYENCFITGYDPWCAHCCGSTSGITASGKEATVGKTIAMYGLAFGTQVYIEGLGTYTVEDRGVGSGVVDVACASHEDCYAITTHANVYIINN